METARLFIGVGLSPRLRSKLYNDVTELIQSHGLIQDRGLAQNQGLTPIKLVPPDNYHLTLAFLGQRPLEEIERLKANLTALTQQTFSQEITLNRIDCFPHASGHLLAAQATTTEILLNLHEACCEIGGIYADNTFKPHITLIRKLPKTHNLKTPLPINDRLTINTASLYHSHSTPSGVKYTKIHQAPLGG
ncbi:MAG: RNA 2',3'-cyclic phosphodiesterase [Cellvibrionaceae bacterium]